jgi:hypothetical protein
VTPADAETAVLARKGGMICGGSAVEGGTRKGRLSNVGSNAGVAGMGGRELPEISRHPAIVHAAMKMSDPVLLRISNVGSLGHLPVGCYFFGLNSLAKR